MTGTALTARGIWSWLGRKRGSSFPHGAMSILKRGVEVLVLVPECSEKSVWIGSGFVYLYPQRRQASRWLNEVCHRVWCKFREIRIHSLIPCFARRRGGGAGERPLPRQSCLVVKRGGVTFPHLLLLWCARVLLHRELGVFVRCKSAEGSDKQQRSEIKLQPSPYL